MSFFDLKIVSFDKIVLNEPASYCAIYTESGKIGFKARHEPFVSVLKNNSGIEYRTQSGKNETVEVQNGLFTFTNNRCTIVFTDKKTVK